MLAPAAPRETATAGSRDRSGRAACGSGRGRSTSTSWPSAPQQLRHGLERAHDAVDLRAPGVGDDGDAQPVYSAASCTGASRGSSVSTGARRSSAQRTMRRRPVEILDQRGAAFDPVAVVAVEDAVDVADLGLVDVAADHAVDAAPARLAGHRVLEVADELDGVLDLVLQVGRQRPVGQAEPRRRPVEPGVEPQRTRVGPVAEDGEPRGVAHDAVELVAVDDQQLRPSAVSWIASSLDLDAAEGEPAVVRAPPRRGCRGCRRRGALARLAQDLLHHVVVALRPVPASASAASRRRCRRPGRASRTRCCLQEVEQQLGLAAARAEMDVGDEDRAMAGRLVTLDHGHVDKTRPAQNLSCAIARHAADCVWRRLRGRESVVTVR